MNLPGDFGTNINEMKNAAETILDAAQRMGDNINTFAQQTATTNTDFAGLREDPTAQGDPERTYLLWNDNNSTVYVQGKTRKVQRGSKKYNKLVAEGYVERDRWMVKPEAQPLFVTNEII